MKPLFLKTPVAPVLLAGFWSFCARNDLSPSVALRRVVAHVLTGAGYDIEDYDPGKERTNDYAQWARRRREKIDLEGVNPILIARVSQGMRGAFERYASARNLGVQDALHQIVRHAVHSANVGVGELTPPKAPPLRAERVTVRLSLDEMSAIQPFADEFGSVREWMVALVRSRIRPDEPQFANREVRALYESNRELWAIGRNINQIAHAMNADMVQAGRLGTSKARVDELEGLKALIDRHTSKVMAMANASVDRWGPQ